jgi:hypothetical protein
MHAIADRFILKIPAPSVTSGGSLAARLGGFHCRSL